MRCGVSVTDVIPILPSKHKKTQKTLLAAFQAASRSPATATFFGPARRVSLPNTRRRQALGSLRSIKHFQASWFFNLKRRLKDAGTQRYSLLLMGS